MGAGGYTDPRPVLDRRLRRRRQRRSCASAQALCSLTGPGSQQRSGRPAAAATHPGWVLAGQGAALIGGPVPLQLECSEPGFGVVSMHLYGKQAHRARGLSQVVVCQARAGRASRQSCSQVASRARAPGRAHGTHLNHASLLLVLATDTRRQAEPWRGAVWGQGGTGETTRQVGDGTRRDASSSCIPAQPICIAEA